MVRVSSACALRVAAQWAFVFSLAGCEQRLDAAAGGCELSYDCARGERCEGGRCVQAATGEEPDNDSGPDSSGSDMQDGGVDGGAPITDPAGCEPDDLGNDSPATAAIASDGERAVAGHLCTTAPVYVAVEGLQGQGMQAFLVWDASSAGTFDLDLRLAGPSDTQGVSIANSELYGVEAATVALATTGRHVAQLEVSGSLPSEGLDYRFEWRTGSPCRTDDECSAAAEVCLMPRWSPGAEPSALPPEVMIFRDGICAEPFAGCSPDLADGAEGSADHRGEAHSGLLPGEAYACQGDEDWYRVTAAANGNLTFAFEQVGTASATYLVTLYDERGNMLQGAGFPELGPQIERQLLVPFVALGTEVWVRVLLLSDDPLGTYVLQSTSTVTACIDDGECASTPEASRFGRIRCVAGACSCPEAECSPAP
ncbi:MAG: hypothetical protein ACO3JL_05980 [Myxococcota bacterium]